MAAVTSVALGVASVGMAAYSADRQQKAQRAQARAQKKANEMERAQANIANQRERRLAAAQLVQQQQFNIAQGAANGGQGSAVMGANIGLSSGMGGAIGFNNTMLAANMYKANVLQQGADTAGRYMNQANWGQVGSGLASQAFGIFSGPKPKR